MTDDEPKPILQHLLELRGCFGKFILLFIFAFVPCYIYSEKIYQLILMPLVKQNKTPEIELIYTGMTEAFLTYVKISVFAAFLLSVPLLLWNLYRFIVPGLYQRERKIFSLYLALSPALFFLGVAFAYFYVIPAAWRFFMSFESKSSLGSIVLMPKVSEYLDLSMKFMIAFGVSFQIPVVLTLLSKAGIIDHNILIRGRKIAIVIIFILAAILTPPDVVSQFGLAIPMILLYELSILACKRDKKRLS